MLENGKGIRPIKSQILVVSRRYSSNISVASLIPSKLDERQDPGLTLVELEPSSTGTQKGREKVLPLMIKGDIVTPLRTSSVVNRARRSEHCLQTHTYTHTHTQNTRAHSAPHTYIYTAHICRVYNFRWKQIKVGKRLLITDLSFHVNGQFLNKGCSMLLNTIGWAKKFFWVFPITCNVQTQMKFLVNPVFPV